MYVNSSTRTARRSADARRRRSNHRDTARQPGGARPVTAAARRTRLADAIVSQWLLEQVPSDHRHALRD
jgi:hypothetical protein